MIKDLLPAILSRYPKLTEDKRSKVLDILRDVHKLNQGSGGLPMIGALALGAIVGAVSAVPFGLVAGGGLLALVLGSGLNYGHGLEFAKNHGCIAHLLDDRLLRRYQEIIGHKALLGEVQQAYAEGIEVTGGCRNFARQSGSPLTKIRTFDIPGETNDSKGSESTQDQGNSQKPTTTVGVAVQNITKDVVEAFVTDLRCTVLCAPPRTGKGIVATGLMMGFKLAYPAGVIFSSTIKQYQPEDWYFSESDYHINPSVDSPIALAKSIYGLYTAWETSNSSADAPSLFVFDELRDTLLALKGVTCEDVSPDINSMEPKFDEWLRNKIISAATLNQCHKRYLLLIAPTSTAQGMTFRDANSLRSYASYTLVTPTELAFTEGNNGTFAAPAIRPDATEFKNWYGLAWSSKSKEWFGVPSVPVESIKLKESQMIKLNYFQLPLPFESVTPSSILGSVSSELGSVQTLTKATPKVTLEPTDEELENAVYEKLVEKVVLLNGEPITLAKLKKNLSKRQSAYYSSLVENLLLEDERFDFETKERSNGDKSISIWLKTDSANNNDDNE
jgi:hypothetical protein